MESESLSLDPDFIEDVGKRLEKEGITDVNEMINRLNKRYTLIRNAEHTTLQQRQRLQTKEKYLKDTLSCVRMLLQRREKDEDTIVDYGLSANVYAKARVPPASNVNLWLGADVMLEYPIEEAESVLQANLDRCTEAMSTNREDWGRIKDCKTTVEVNIARCHNWDVQRRKQTAASE